MVIPPLIYIMETFIVMGILLLLLQQVLGGLWGTLKIIGSPITTLLYL
jgi:hypothetical protein